MYISVEARIGIRVSIRRAALLSFAAATLATAQTKISNVLPFEANEGGDIPHYQTIVLLSPAGAPGTARTADIAVDSKPGPSWLSVTPGSGSAPGILFVNASTTGRTK